MASIRNSSNKYHMPVAETGDFHALIDNEQPTKKKQEAYEKLLEEAMIIRLETYQITRFFQKHYKIIGIGLSRQMNTNILKQINFMRKFEENDRTSKRFLLPKSSKKLILKFSLNSLNMTK